MICSPRLNRLITTHPSKLLLVNILVNHPSIFMILMINSDVIKLYINESLIRISFATVVLRKRSMGSKQPKGK